MNPLYPIIANLAGPPLALAASLRGRFGGHWRERLGLRFAPPPAWGRPRLWFHAASVGEVRSAGAVIRAFLELRPEAEMYLSAGTPAGLVTATQIFAAEPRVRTMAAPLDFWGAPRRLLTRIRPSALVILETELWPTMIQEADRAGLALVLAAGRLTDRSFRRYRLIRPFMADLLGRFALIAPAGNREMELFRALGAPAGRLKVLGNPKFDHLLAEADSEDFALKKTRWETRLWGDRAEGPRPPLLVAGSTHPGEEAVMLEALIRLRAGRSENMGASGLPSGPTPPVPDAATAAPGPSGGPRLALAPRHLGRVPEVLELARSRGLTALPTSEEGPPLLGRADVVVLDTLGQLTALYALADAALVGGSLLPGLTGHNPLEPAATATPLMFGPAMSSFAREAEELLAAGGAVRTAPDTLADDLARWLDDPALARTAGRAARDCLAARPPAAPALARAISRVLLSGRAPKELHAAAPS